MDTVRMVTSLLDTLHVDNVVKDQSLYEMLAPWMALIGAAIGFLGSFFAQWYFQKVQNGFEIQKELFSTRLSIYRQISECLWEIYSVKIDMDKPTQPYSKAYDSLETLRIWLRNSVELYDRNRILLDTGSYSEFENLNRIILTHIREAEGHMEPAGSIVLQNIGRKSVGELQAHVNKILESIVKFMKEKYKVELDLPKVT